MDKILLLKCTIHNYVTGLYSKIKLINVKIYKYFNLFKDKSQPPSPNIIQNVTINKKIDPKIKIALRSEIVS